MRAKPDISKRDHGMAEMMLARANAGWYIGDMPIDPETFQPFIPTGEVYDLTRWISGLTPEKVDR